MTPIKLTMKNIGPFYGEVTMDFSMYKGIFLIAGDTGAGKTTILDAICYAFFSRSPSFLKDTSKSFRSDFVKENEDAFVDFNFSISEGANKNFYRIFRALPTEKKGAPCKLFFSEDGKNFDEIAGGKRELENKIKDIIKLSYEEFSKVIMLPQGEFSDFIKQNSTQRVEILKNIFNVQKFSNFVARVEEAAATKSTEVSNLESQIQKLQEIYNDVTYENEVEEALSRIENLKNDFEKISKDLDQKKSDKLQGETLAVKRKELDAENENFKKLMLDEKTIEEKKYKLDKAQKVAPLIIKQKNIASLTDEKKNIEEKLLTLRKEKNETQKILDELKSNTAIKEIERQTALRENLIQQEDRYSQSRHIYEELLHDKEVFSKLEKEFIPKKEIYETQEVKLKSLEDSIEPFNEEIKKLNEYSVKVDEAKEALENIKKLEDILKPLNEKKLTLKASNINLNKITDNLKQIEKNILDAEQELKTLETEKEKNEQAQIAGKLVKTLTENSPCPVCGSLHHPSPAKLELLSDSSFDDQIEKSKKSIETFKSKKNAELQSCGFYEGNIKTLELEVKTLEDKLAALDFQEMLNDTEIESKKEFLIAELNLATKNLTGSKQASEKKSMAEEKIKKIKATLKDFSEELDSLDKQLTETKTNIKVKTQQLVKNLSLNSEDELNKISLEVELEKISAEKAKLERIINSHKEKTKEYETKFEKQKTQIQENESKLFSVAKDLESKNVDFENDCKKISIEKESVVSFYLDDEKITEFTKDIAEFNENKIATNQKIKSLEEELKNTKVYDLEKLDIEIKNLSKERDEINEYIITERTKLSESELLHKQYTELCSQHEKAVNNANAIKALADKVSGNNAKKTKFDTWRLSYLFRQAITFANRRFTKISNDRYFLEISTEAQTKKGFAGLNLVVYDSHTGKTRFVSSLSGGETFIASVCIALGLADTLTNNAGGIKINAMFIDEGFGSLDAENLARVFHNLELVTQSESLELLGIISHVADLEMRVPQKLRVIKTNHGSRIEQ